MQQSSQGCGCNIGNNHAYFHHCVVGIHLNFCFVLQVSKPQVKAFPKVYTTMCLERSAFYNSMASDVDMDRVLDNPTYGEGETFINSTNALPGATI